MLALTCLVLVSVSPLSTVGMPQVLLVVLASSCGFLYGFFGLSSARARSSQKGHLSTAHQGQSCLVATAPKAVPREAEDSAELC